MKKPNPLPASVRFSNPIQPAFLDASGCPAVVEVRGYRFACDCLGEPTLRLIAPVSGSRRESRIASSIARKDYATALAQVTDAAWREKNRMLYLEQGTSQ